MRGRGNVMKQIIGKLNSKLFEQVEEGRSERTAVQVQHREGFIRIPAHFINEDWHDEWETTAPELIHDVLLSEEESLFDPNRNEHEG